jgi:catechol 2,3-dioxygenase-like lactoylglutathione lyase family enzyme
MKINFKRLDHVQISIPKGAEEKARRFYSGVLDLEEIEKPDSLKPSGGVWFKIADVELHLGVESIFSQYSGWNPFTKQHLAIEVENIDEVKKFLTTKRVGLKEEIQIPGRKRFSFFDPFGNRIELIEFL